MKRFIICAKRRAIVVTDFVIEAETKVRAMQLAGDHALKNSCELRWSIEPKSFHNYPDIATCEETNFVPHEFFTKEEKDKLKSNPPGACL
jgi:hypothetical protein